jgi:CRISP-associated protein Cas1
VVTPAVTLPGLPPPRPIPLKDRASLVFVERAQLEVQDGAFVAVNADGTRTRIPVGGPAGIMLEPGARISHAGSNACRPDRDARHLGGRSGRSALLRRPARGARSDRLLWQAAIALDPEARLRVVRRMYALRFGEEPPQRRSIDQLRGIEGARVRGYINMMVRNMAEEVGFEPTEGLRLRRFSRPVQSTALPLLPRRH